MTSARLWAGRSTEKRGVTLPALGISEGMRNEIGIDRQPVFVRIGVLVGTGGQVDGDDVLAPDVMVGVPNQTRNVDDAPVLLGQVDNPDLAAGRRVRTNVVKHELHLTLQQDVAVLVLLMESPTFD